MTARTGRTSCRAWWLAVAVLGAWSAGAADAAGQGAATGRVLVVAFEADASSARTFWLGEGAALLVGDELQALGVTTVGRRHRVRALEELRLPETGPLSRATMIRLGHTIGADTVVLGGVHLDEQTVTVRARVLALEPGSLRPEIVERGEVAELDAVCRRLAGRLLDDARGLVAVGARAAAVPPAPLDALEAFVKALLTPTPEPRRQLLETALAKHPGYDRARLALWEAHRDLGEHEQALAAARAVGEASPLRRRALFAGAVSAMDLLRYDEAFETLKALVDEEPRSAPVLNNLGVVQIRRGSTAHTGTPAYYFSKATEADPDDADYYFNLGYAYWLAKDPQASIYWLREAVRRNPADADAHFVLGAALAAAGAAAESAREAELARRLSARYERSTTTDVPRGLERVSEDVDAWQPLRFEEGVTRVLQRDQRELASFHLERGRRLFEDQKDREAMGELRRALYLSPYEAEAHLLLGRIYLRTGRTPDAIDALRIAIWSGETAAAQIALAEALLEADDEDGARTAAERALVLEPEAPGALAVLARVAAAR